ncbi:MAG: AAA family ATPase, partial [Gemmataceae bacterium]|nr:AAA family ATPase [Gemmataceae bacterium]
MADDKPEAEPVLLARLRAHFAADPSKLPVVEQAFAAYERANLHLALQALLAEQDRAEDPVGVLALEYRSPGLARLARARSAADYDEGPVEYADAPLPGGRNLSCIKSALCLAANAAGPLAVLVTESERSYSPNPIIEVMAPAREEAERFLRELALRTRQGRAFKGHVLSLETDCYRQLSVKFHALPNVTRESLILPEALLQRIERHTLSFTRHAERLRAAGRHLKRGILLHGPPGTGKTLTAMYLASQMPGRTVMIMTGNGMGSVETACALARALAPATLILEDVDLVGTERSHQTVGANAILFELLNEMDGLGEDADILFVLTTNRPEELEPALAARPGRIDQAIEVPPPDAECRRRMIDLYGKGLRLEVGDWPRLIARTEGASGAFLRELLRKAAVFAAEESEGELAVRDA